MEDKALALAHQLLLRPELALVRSIKQTSRLSPAQKETVRGLVTIVKSRADYDAVIGPFALDCRENAVCTVDMESYLAEKTYADTKLKPNYSAETRSDLKRRGMLHPEHVMATYMAYILVGTTSGRVLALDLRSMANKSELFSDYEEAIPNSFRGLMMVPTVVKFGSGLESDLTQDFLPLDIPISPLVDTSATYERVRDVTMPEDPGTKQYHRGRRVRGLEKVSVFLGGPYFKPSNQTEREQIYDWQDPPTDIQTNYLRLDALGLVHYAVLGAARLRPKAPNLRTAVLTAWAPFFRVASTDDWELTADEYDTTFRDPAVVPAELRNAATEQPPPASVNTESNDTAADPGAPNPVRRTPDPLPAWQEEPLVASVASFTLPPPRFPIEVALGEVSFANFVRVRDGSRSIPNSLLDPAVKVPLPYKHNFYLTNRCFFCASSEHKRLTKRRDLNCPVAIDLRDRGCSVTCSYPLCVNKYGTHSTLACPTLHLRCNRCALRGHNADHCRTYDQQLLLNIFECHADLSLFCRYRREHLQWGAFPVVANDRFRSSGLMAQFPCSYDDLLELPIPEAMALVCAYNREVRAAERPDFDPLPAGCTFTDPYRD